MGHACIQVIYDEHSSISAILKSLRMMIRRGPQNEPEIFFDVMRAMLFYIDEVPEKQHHPKETAFLFPPVAKRSPQCAELIEQLEKDHDKGEASVRELQHLLLGWEMLGDSRREAFEEATLKFVDFYSEHLLLEESIIIPEAFKVLTEEEWTKLNAAFEINIDPISGKKTRDPIYDRLFAKIALRAPAPIGLGHE